MSMSPMADPNEIGPCRWPDLKSDVDIVNEC